MQSKNGTAGTDDTVPSALSEDTTACEVRQQDLQARVESEHGTTMVEYPLPDGIVLAGQPQPEDWQKLAERGFTLVVNMRSDPERAARQAQNAEAAGIRSLHLPLPAYELEPIHLEEFRDVVARAHAREEKLMIHCRTASRTALLWMLQRISYDGWSQAEAEAELRAAGYGDEDMEVFNYCAEDYFERVVDTDLYV